jgi:hypothetical protein
MARVAQLEGGLAGPGPAPSSLEMAPNAPQGQQAD